MKFYASEAMSSFDGVLEDWELSKFYLFSDQIFIGAIQSYENNGNIINVYFSNEGEVLLFIDPRTNVPLTFEAILKNIIKPMLKRVDDIGTYAVANPEEVIARGGLEKQIKTITMKTKDREFTPEFLAYDEQGVFDAYFEESDLEDIDARLEDIELLVEDILEIEEERHQVEMTNISE